MVAFDDNGKIDILGLLPDELEAEILKLGEKKFRAGQIFDWLHVKRVSSFDEMTNLSVQLRNLLNEKFCLKSLFVSKKLESHTDNTVKYLYELEDGNHVESVIMEYNYGNTICVSTQVGCKMGCRFCASTIIRISCASMRKDGFLITVSMNSARKIYTQQFQRLKNLTGRSLPILFLSESS